MGSKFSLASSNSKLPSSISYIWEEYISDCKSNSTYSYEMNQKTLTYNNKSLTFDLLIKGDLSKNNNFPLYLILHNGGIGQPSYNNSEFLKARLRYQSCIHYGVICGIRGVTDLSNMHYCKESLILLDRLIKNLIVFYKVDPNRVYIIGLGFGGDGVYQIINLLSTRFAAAVVISGHSYGKTLKNVLNVHLLIQVGENDTFFDKNKDAVKTYKRINEHYKNFIEKCKNLNKNIINIKDKNNNFVGNITTKNSKNKTNIIGEKSCCECYIHIGYSQELNDNDKKIAEIPIVADPIKWMTSDTGNEIINQNINSINFLNKFVRDPLPKKLFWDLTCTIGIPTTYKKIDDNLNKDNMMMKDTRTANDGFFSRTISGTTTKEKEDKYKDGFTNINQYFYWLEIGNVNVNSLGSLSVIARYETKNNSVYIDSQIKFIRILLNDTMMDLSKDINVYYNGSKKSLKVNKNYQTERRTLAERGDYTYIFSACIIFECKERNDFKIWQFEEI